MLTLVMESSEPSEKQSELLGSSIQKINQDEYKSKGTHWKELYVNGNMT